ncbi:hypothetical protein DFA_08104 [Cavenderia fasciculata]|uniref:Transmembrane protein n=1 Tax=Cavenderia fasciculata TaxID=261658 RepID=F4Q563_CACFS|nr:uncharacterized protein DFA_08104 [Cavenderia fasciculata]EGG17122.1 hypothetical protein DFA_08104 [Cavenderia fasciculata]|eukprot:XP_004355606.1 hypothetical protein DFA_08104 [Cavenderia fasciculata]
MYFSNNKKNNVLYSVPYFAPGQHEYQPLMNDEKENNKDKLMYPIGEGYWVHLEQEEISSIVCSSVWGYIICIIQLLVGIVLFLFSGYGSFFTLVFVAMLAHIFSVSLGIYSITKKNVLLMLNYAVYSVVIFAITVAVFIIATIVSAESFTWWIFIICLTVINVQIYGIKHLFQLAMLLRQLQGREVDRLTGLPQVQIPISNIPTYPYPTTVNYTQPMQPPAQQQQQTNSQPNYYPGLYAPQYLPTQPIDTNMMRTHPYDQPNNSTNGIDRMGY